MSTTYSCVFVKGAVSFGFEFDDVESKTTEETISVVKVRCLSWRHACHDCESDTCERLHISKI